MRFHLVYCTTFMIYLCDFFINISRPPLLHLCIVKPYLRNYSLITGILLRMPVMQCGNLFYTWRTFCRNQLLGGSVFHLSVTLILYRSMGHICFVSRSMKMFRKYCLTVSAVHTTIITEAFSSYTTLFFTLICVLKICFF